MGTLQTTITVRTSPTGGTRLYPNIVSYRGITNDDLVKYMVSNSGINKATALAAVAALRRLIYNYVLNGHTIKIPQLGTFSLVAKTKAVTKEEDAGANCIKNLKIRFSPIKDTKIACKSVRFKGILPEEDALKMLH